MSNTRMWLMETDQYGCTDRKHVIDNPKHIPRAGEFIDSVAGTVGGWVTHVQYTYNDVKDARPTFTLVINVFLSKDKP